VSVGAWALFVGVGLATLDSVSVVSHALRPRDATAREPELGPRRVHRQIAGAMNDPGATR
jgi:hypothetical protein